MFYSGHCWLNTRRTTRFIENFTRFMSLMMTPGFCWRVGTYHKQVLHSSAEQRFVKLVGGPRTSCVARNMNSISDFSRPERAFNTATRTGVSIAKWTDCSVSTKNIARLHKQRLKIEQSLEDFLRSNRELTSGRLAAMTRSDLNSYDLRGMTIGSFAVNIIDTIKASQPTFAPASPAARFRYRLIYKTLGFQMAQRLAQKQRRELQS